MNHEIIPKFYLKIVQKIYLKLDLEIVPKLTMNCPKPVLKIDLNIFREVVLRHQPEYFF